MSWQVPPNPWGRVPVAPKPGVIPLKPLSVGEVLGGVVQTLRRYFWPVYAPLLVLGAVAVAGLGVLVALAYPDAHRLYDLAQDHVADRGWHPAWHDVSGLLGTLGVGLGLFFVLTLLISLTGVLTGIAVLRHAAVGRRVTARQLLGEALGAFWRLLGAMLLLGAGFLLWYVLGVVVVLGAGVGTRDAGVAFLAALLWLVSGVGVLYVYVRLALLQPVIVLEGAGPFAAFGRAWRLNEGAWWRSLGIPLLTSLVTGLALQFVLSPVSVVAMAVTGTSTPSMPSDPADLNVSAYLLTMLLSSLLTVPVAMLLQVLAQPVVPVTLGLLYIDRRIRRESLDVQLAAEAGIAFGPYAPGPQAPGPYVPPQAPPPVADTPVTDGQVDLGKKPADEES